MTEAFTVRTLPANDNVNCASYCCLIDQRPLIVREGKMIAYFGQLKFERLGAGPLGGLVREAFNAPNLMGAYIAAQGRGKLIIADRGLELTAFDVADDQLIVRAAHLVAFEPTLFLQQSFVPGYVQLQGTGRFVLSSSGPAFTLAAPCRVDEQALLGWMGVPAPNYRYDWGARQPKAKGAVQAGMQVAKALAGLTRSGEEQQVEFVGEGTVFIQSSERASGAIRPLA